MNLFLQILLQCLLIIFLAWLFWDYRGSGFREFYIPKLRTRKLYGVSDKTFQRWLERFMPYYAPKWKGRKKISVFERALILLVLGDPKEFPTLNLSIIISMVEENEKEDFSAAKYRTLHGIVPELKTRFAGMKTFPPRIAQQIYLIAKGELDPQEPYAF